MGNQNTKLENDITSLIEKNLPAQVGNVLKQTLEQAEKDAEKVVHLSKDLSERDSTIENLRQKIEEYKAFDKRNSDLEDREEKVDLAERELKVQKLQYELSCEKDKTNFTKEVALGLVRNTNYRKVIFDSENQDSYQDANGVWHYPHPVNKHYNESKTTE